MRTYVRASCETRDGAWRRVGGVGSSAERRKTPRLVTRLGFFRFFPSGVARVYLSRSRVARPKDLRSDLRRRLNHPATHTPPPRPPVLRHGTLHSLPFRRRALAVPDGCRFQPSTGSSSHHRPTAEAVARFHYHYYRDTRNRFLSRSAVDVLPTPPSYTHPSTKLTPVRAARLILLLYVALVRRRAVFSDFRADCRQIP